MSDEPTAEQQARDLLKAIGVEDAQSYSTGDLVFIANAIADGMPNEALGHAMDLADRPPHSAAAATEPPSAP